MVVYRALTAFWLFSNSKREEAKAAGDRALEVPEVMSMWRALSRDEKQVWEERERVEQKRYFNDVRARALWDEAHGRGDEGEDGGEGDEDEKEEEEEEEEEESSVDGAAGAAGRAVASVEPHSIFARRYTPGTRPWCPFHHDVSRCTVNVALSTDGAHREGGRLLAVYDGCVHQLEREEGTATVHPSSLLHAVPRTVCRGYINIRVDRTVISLV